MPTNVTCVAFVPTKPSHLAACLVGSVDKKLRVLALPEGRGEAETGLVLETLLESPPLSLDVSELGPAGAEPVVAGEEGPEAATERPREIRAVVTCMGGEAHVLEVVLAAPGTQGAGLVAELHPTQRFQNHTKHATVGRLAPGARRFCTVSRDHRACLYAEPVPTGADEVPFAPPVRAAGSNLYGTAFPASGSSRTSAGSSGVERPFAPLGPALVFLGEVTTCAWLSAAVVALAVRNDNYLHLVDTATRPAKVARRMNMNALGDDVVSFAVLDLCASRDGELLLACTDNARVILFEVATGQQLRNFYGASVDEYDLPTVIFSLDETFVYATSTRSSAAAAASEGPCGEVVVWAVQTGAQVLTLPAHQKGVRCLSRHPYAEALVSGSFDKTVSFFG